MQLIPYRSKMELYLFKSQISQLFHFFFMASDIVTVNKSVKLASLV